MISSHELRKNGDFEILKSGDSRPKRKFGKPKYWEKYIDLAQCLEQLGRKQELQNQFARLQAKQLDKNKLMAFDDWISQVVV